MKTLLVISMLFAINPAFASSDLYQDCMDREYSSHHEMVKKAQETLRRDTEDCYRYPMGQRYSKCQHQAQKKYEKAVERADSILKQRTKSCLKYPWL